MRRRRILTLLGAGTPLLPACDPFLWHLFPGGSLLVATITAAVACGFSIHVGWLRCGPRWGLLLAFLGALATFLNLVTLQALLALGSQAPQTASGLL